MKQLFKKRLRDISIVSSIASRAKIEYEAKDKQEWSFDQKVELANWADSYLLKLGPYEKRLWKEAVDFILTEEKQTPKTRRFADYPDLESKLSKLGISNASLVQ